MTPEGRSERAGRVDGARARFILKLTLITFGLVTVMVLAIAGQIISVLIRKPTIRTDYSREIAARLPDVPEPERGYPIYLSAITAELGLSEAQQNLLEDHDPDDPAWRKSVGSVLSDHQPLLDFIRQAAAKPYAAAPIAIDLDPAFVLASGVTPETTPNPGGPTPAPRYAAPAGAPPLIVEILLPMLRKYRMFAKYLQSDAIIAITDDGGTRVVTDVLAMAGLARHSREDGVLISQLAGNAITSLATDTVLEAIHTNPHAFSDADLARIAEALRDLRDNHTAISFEIERWVYADLLQRLFTDDGTGDGVIAPTAAQAMFRKLGILDPSMPTGLAAAALAPIASTRAEMQAAFDAIMDNVQQAADTPLWQLEDRRLDAQTMAQLENIQSWDDTFPPDLSKLYLSAFIPALSKSLTIGQFTAQRLDAALLTIAVHRHHLRTGQWPASLEAIPADLLPEPPIDRHTGKPLIYRVTATGPLIYGTGPDTDDDQGRPAADPDIWFPAATRAQRVASDVTKYEGDWVFYPPPDDE